MNMSNERKPRMISGQMNGRPFGKLACMVLFALLFPAALTAGADPEPPGKKPNIIYILTDDLGYGDVGVFFQNLRRTAGDHHRPWALTPYLDEMAAEGMTLEQYAAAPV